MRHPTLSETVGVGLVTAATAVLGTALGQRNAENLRDDHNRKVIACAQDLGPVAFKAPSMPFECNGFGFTHHGTGKNVVFVFPPETPFIRKNYIDKKKTLHIDLAWPLGAAAMGFLFSAGLMAGSRKLQAEKSQNE